MCNFVTADFRLFGRKKSLLEVTGYKPCNLVTADFRPLERKRSFFGVTGYKICNFVTSFFRELEGEGRFSGLQVTTMGFVTSVTPFLGQLEGGKSIFEVTGYRLKEFSYMKTGEQIATTTGYFFLRLQQLRVVRNLASGYKSYTGTICNLSYVT